MFKNAIAAAALLAVAGFSGQALADTSTNTFQARIIITKVCDVTTTAPTDLDFGTHVAGTDDVDTTSTVTVKCAKGTDYTIGLLPGNSNTSGAGAMVAQNVAPTVSNTDTVAYNLYADSARTAAWGNTGSNLVSGTGKGLSVTTDTYTVYGRVPSTDFTPDSYLDTVTVTLTY